MSKPFFIFIVVAAFVVVAAVAWFANNQSQLGNSTSTTNAVVVTNTADKDESNLNQNSNGTANSNVDVNVTATGFTLLKEANSSVNGDITSYTFTENNVLNVMPAEMQSITVAETAVQTRESITVGEVTGERLTVSSAKDGSAQTVIQIVRNGQLYDFRGSAEFLDDLTKYIQFN